MPYNYSLNPSASNKREQMTPAQRIREALESLRTTMATWSGDWSQDKRLAWVYGIIMGWEDATDEVAKKFRWSSEDADRMNRLHEALSALDTIEEESRWIGK